MANSITWLLLARLVQGFGASSGSVLTQTIARESLHDQKRHRFFSAAGFAIAFSIALGPFIFIRLLHLTASQYGWLGSLVALAALVGSLAFRHLIKRFSVTQLIAAGCIIMLVSSIILVLTCVFGVTNTHDKLLAVILIMLPMMGIIFGSFGFIIPMTLSTALQKHQAVLGTAGALFGLSYYILIALLTWVMGLIHNGTIYPMPFYFLILSLISFAVCRSLMRKDHA